MCFSFWRCCSETAQPRRTTLPQATHVFSSCHLHLSSSTTKPQFKWIPRRTWRFQAPKRCHVAVSRRKILCGKNVAATYWVAAKIMPPVLRFTVSGAAWWSWHGMRLSPWHPIASRSWRTVTPHEFHATWRFGQSPPIILLLDSGLVKLGNRENHPNGALKKISLRVWAEWDPHLLDLESLESESWQRFPASWTQETKSMSRTKMLWFELTSSTQGPHND